MEAKWDELSSIFSKIQGILDKLIRSPDSIVELSTLQQQLKELWSTYQNVGKEARELTTDEEDLKTLEGAITKAMRAYNIASQGIENKLEKLQQQEAAKAEEQRTTSNGSPHQVRVEPPQAIEQVDVHALHVLLSQIANQFNQIVDGQYPKPAPQEKGPMLQAVDDSSQVTDATDADPGQDQHAVQPAADSHKHRASAVLSGPQPNTAQPNATTPPELPRPNQNHTPQAVSTCTTNQSTASDIIQQPTIELKMDKFTLPVFDGDLTNWLPFRDQFTDLVHNNPKYTPITKFIQLRGHLKGSAMEAIQGFKLSAANYEAAWYILVRRYDKPDQIVDEYLRKLTDLPPISTPTAQRLISMVNCANQILRVLPTLGVDVTSWDAIVKYNLTSKLDRTTHKKWLDQVKLRQSVPLEELIDFLEIEASESLPMPGRSYQPPEQRRHQRFRQQPSAVLTTVTDGAEPTQSREWRENRCPQCKGNHPLFLCHTFKKLKVKDRISKVRIFKHCMRCLLKHNQPADCKFGMCPVCTKDHNKLLCYTHEKGTTGAHVSTLHSKEA